MTATPQRPRRPLTDQNDPPPPSLPPRPGGRGALRPPPKTPVTADSDDGSNTDPEDYVEPANKNGASNGDQPEEVYDDFDEKPPPLPPHPSHPPADPEGQEIYDDCNEEVQEIYDDVNEELPRPGPIVQHLPKKPVRNLPPPPPPELSKMEEVDEVYEDPDASQPENMRPKPVVIPYHKRPPSPVRQQPSEQAVSSSQPSSFSLRPSSPTCQRSLGRKVSPARPDERALPPLPPAEQQHGWGHSQGSLPLVPPIGSRRSPSPTPVPAVRNRHKGRDQDKDGPSPVVVPLKSRHKAVLPPLPPAQSVKPSKHGAAFKVGNGELPPPPVDATNEHGEESLEHVAEAEDMEWPESRSVYEFDPDESGPQTESDTEDFPPPPSPISDKKLMISSPPLPPPPPPPPLPHFVPPSPPEGDSVYEVGDSEMSSSLPPPLPPPKDQKRPEARLPPQPKGTSTSVTKLPGGPGMFIDPNQLLGLKKNLRKVSTEDKPGEKNNSAHEPKEYGDCSQTVFEVKRKLEGKADGRPGISPKPVPISGGVNTFSSKGNNSTVTNGSSTPNALKPNHAVRSPPVSGQQSTSDVTFLPKANKDKHTNVPLPPVPAPHQQLKPAVSKFESKPEVVMPPDPEEIYDDATSGDLLERYEWFHGIIDRQNGESRVKSVGKDGTYLVRVSEKDPTFPYTLVVLHNSHVNNLRIRKRQKDGKFALGDEKSDELAFTDVPAMISHHKNHHVVLLGNSQSHVKLQQTPPKG